MMNETGNKKMNEAGQSSSAGHSDQKQSTETNEITFDPIHHELPDDDQYDEVHDQDRIVRHIMVIGFHHKHGYQVDYCYPPLIPNGPMFTTPQRPITLPACWKTLPLLCLPDGSHNYDSDTIYFTMPADDSIDNHNVDNNDDNSSTNLEQRETNKQTLNDATQKGIKTLFGTACYRQIHVEKLLHRTDDMTRVAVQKSVCVLSTQPLFGLIRSKLEMITHAYFEELDFSKVRILKLTYNNLNSLLARESVRDNATFLGLSARHLVSFFGNNMLVLFKAMLLEKKILFYKSPVRDLCSTIMSMCSLFNGLIECGGLDYSTCDLQLSPSLLEALKLEPHTPNDCDQQQDLAQQRHPRVFFSPRKDEVFILSDDDNDDGNVDGQQDRKKKPPLTPNEQQSIISDKSPIGRTLINHGNESRHEISTASLNDTQEYEVINNSSCLDAAEEAVETSFDETVVDDAYAHKLCLLKPEECGLPLQIFNRGSFCLPYLSISYLDLLSDNRVRSFVIGATNFLFKQKRDMYDIIVDMEENQIIINDASLKRLLNLTTEDLRFMDYLVKNVKLIDQPNTSGNNNSIDSQSSWDHYFDTLNMQEVTKWIGGDEWIRYHFKIYTLYLLKAAKSYHPHHSQAANNQAQPQSSSMSTSLSSNLINAAVSAATSGGSSISQMQSNNQRSQQQQQQNPSSTFVDSFNASFIHAWKHHSNSYRQWDATGKSPILDGLQARHPFGSSQARGGINFNDMKLRLSYAVNSSEKGRLVSQTLNGIGKWSIWNNLASAGNAAANSIGTSLATSAASAHSVLVQAASAAANQMQPEENNDADDDDYQHDKQDQTSRTKTGNQ